MRTIYQITVCVNQNIEYEKLAQEIYQELINANDLNTIDIQHNIKLTGKSGQKRQIDVYWEYKEASIDRKFVIECKNYNRKITLDKVDAFYSAISDLDDVKGIMVTKTGYQSGAKKVAESYGITLIELRYPNEEEGKVGKIDLSLEITITQSLFLIDEDWAKTNNIDYESYRSFMASLSQLSSEWAGGYFPLETIEYDNVFNEKGQIINTLNELRDELLRGVDHVCYFENAYVNTHNWGKVKIRAFKCVTNEKKEVKQFNIDARNIIKAIHKNVLNGEVMYFLRK